MLAGAGAEIVGRNVAVPGGEIDLVAVIDGVRTVVEVRTVLSEPGPLAPDPVAALDDVKVALVRRHARRLGGVRRIDLMAVRFWSAGVDVHWLPRAG